MCWGPLYGECGSSHHPVYLLVFIQSSHVQDDRNLPGDVQPTAYGILTNASRQLRREDAQVEPNADDLGSDAGMSLNYFSSGLCASYRPRAVLQYPTSVTPQQTLNQVFSTLPNGQVSAYEPGQRVNGHNQRDI